MNSATNGGNISLWGYTEFCYNDWETVNGGLYRDVASYSNHSAAIRQDGAPVAWGYNGYGQCDPPPGLNDCVQVATGASHTAVLRSDGRVDGWGLSWTTWNTDGRPPVDLGHCRKIAAADNRTVAIRIDGTVVEWGLNVQHPPQGMPSSIDIAAGKYHTIVLGADAVVRSWGQDFWFDGYNTGYAGQTQVPSSLGPCVKVAAGWFHSLAIRNNGTLVAWGWNLAGQTDIPSNLGPCVGAAAGYSFSLALKADGSVVQVGGGSPFVPPQHQTPYSVLAGGKYHAVVIAGPPAIDSDIDGFPDHIDNCPAIANPTQADCNSNGVGDVCEIAAGAPDFNHDTIPDTCQCLADLFVDGQVNGGDLGALLSQWGSATANTASDLNRDGFVNGADLGYLLNAWGPCSN
jgi:hypothetical protein